MKKSETDIRKQIRQSLNLFYQEGFAVEICCMGPDACTSELWEGWTRNDRIVAGWFNNLNKAQDLIVDLENDSVAVAIINLINRLKKNSWEGTASELKDKLELEVGVNIAKNRMVWPQTASTLSRRIKRAGSALRAQGIEVEHIRNSSERIIKISKGSMNDDDMGQDKISRSPPLKEPVTNKTL